MYHSRRNSSICDLANDGSIRANGTAWNARSQAAYQGYSHLSGMETTSRLNRCCAQVPLRMSPRPGGGGGCAGASPSSQSLTTKWYTCRVHTSPATACRATRASSAVALGGVWNACQRSASARRRSNSASNVGPNAASGCAWAAYRRRRTSRVAPGGIDSAYHPAAFVPVRPGCTASRNPSTTRRWKASLTYGALFLTP
jgi:hypothetical protein